MSRELHDGGKDGLEPLEAIDVRQATGFADMLRRMSRTAFGGRELGEAFEVLSAMAADPDCTIVVTVSGAMTVAKMGKVLCEMIDAGLAHIIVSTGAIMAHGLSEATGGVHYKADPHVTDKQLYTWGYNRVYDTVEMEANLCRAWNLVKEVLDEMDHSQPSCSWLINRAIGKKLLETGQMPSILGCAYRRETPVYVPALTDSELGLDLAKHALERDFVPGKEADLEKFFAPVPSYNPFLDLHNYAQRISKGQALGHFYHRRGRAQELGPAGGAVCGDHKHADGGRSSRAAVPLCGADLPGTGALGRIERMHLFAKAFPGVNS